jgi:outer membrane receptor protein involved in Fe transport
MKLYKLTILFLFLFLSHSSYSQIEIRGVVTASSNIAIEFANVVLTNQSNEIIAGTITDENGNFKLDIEGGIYILKVTYLGYEAWEREISITDNSIQELITLYSSSSELDEVVINAKKKLISRKGDKIVMNISNNAFADGKSTSEILKYAPNVWVDQSSNAISLKGLTATILINGRKSNLSNDNLMSYLNGLSNKELKSIEIISNPSARYDAEGLGGIINIITNKPKERGLSGNFNSRLNFSKFLSQSNSIQINSRINKKLSLNTFLLYQENNNLTHENRTESISSPQTIYNYKKIDTTESSDIFANFDLQYDISDRDQLVFAYRVLDSKKDRSQNNELIIEDDLTTSSEGLYKNNRVSDYFALGLNYNKKLDSLGQNVNFIVDYFNSDAQSNNNYNNLFFDGNTNELVDNNTRKSSSKSSYKIISSQVDYKNPYKKNHSFEYGTKYSLVENKSESLFENLIGSEYVIDNNFTNAFNYNEQIIATYGSYAIENLFDSKLNLQIGVRGEYTRGEGNIIESSFKLKKDYFNIFPSFFLTKKIQNRKSIGVSISRRISRPNYRRFNPTIFYLTDFTSQVGNPDLDPSYTNAFEINYNSSNLNVQLYLNDINGEGREILTQLSDTELKYQWRNIDETSIYGLSVLYNKDITKWWTIFLNSNWYGKQYRSSFQDAVDNINEAKGTIQFRLASQFKLPYKMSSEISFEYNGSETYGQFESGENYAFYLDFSKKITKDLSFYLKVIDPLDKLRYTFKNSQQGYQTNQFRNNFNRTVRFSLQFNFNSGNKTKNVRYKRSSQDLRNRSN